MILPCNCGAASSGRWADVHAPTCETFGETPQERHAALRRMEYRAIDAQAGAIDYRAIRHFQLWLEARQSWHQLANFNRRSAVQQTVLARQWEDQIDEGQYRQEQALGGPFHDRDRYADSSHQQESGMSTHTIQTEIEVRFSFPGLAEGDHETAHPTVEITYDYSRGSPAFTPRGEYGPIDPPEPPGLAFREAKYIDRDGLDEDPVKLQHWAEEWLMGDGYDYACDCAETDLHAMRHAQ